MTVSRILTSLTFLCFTFTIRPGLSVENMAPSDTVTSSNRLENYHDGDYRKKVAYKVGDTEIQLKIFQQKKPKFFYLSLHDNENTAVEATEIIIRQNGGRLVEIKAQGQRMIGFSVKGKQHLFDPNRIFTDKGALNTLNRNGRYSIAAHREIRLFAKHILQYVRSFDLTPIVAVHNNSDGNLSIATYSKQAADGGGVEAVFRNPEKDADDFFYVNYEKFYHFFKSRGFNVVLQNNQTVTDDGSLSVYCGRINRPYINVEAQHGHLAAQIEMLKALQDLSRTNH